MVIGKVLTITELMKEHGYEAVFIASGAGLPQFMHIPGEGHVGVYSANEYLTRINLMKAYDEKSSTPVLKVSPQRLSAAATWLWTRLAAPNVWGPMSTSFIAAVKLNCQHDSKKSITPRKKESTSTSLTSPVEIRADEKAAFLPFVCQEDGTG